jgi:hypothetical protein
LCEPPPIPVVCRDTRWRDEPYAGEPLNQPSTLRATAMRDYGPDAEVKGAEWELRTKSRRSLTLTQGAGWTQAAFSTRYIPAAVVEGQPLYGVPKWTISRTLHFNHLVSSTLDLSATATNSYVTIQRTT